MIALFFVWQRHRRPDIAMACNGLLGGLVAITRGARSSRRRRRCSSASWRACSWWVAVSTLERRFRLDDPVGAVAVHGVAGTWGTLAVGIFADGSYGERWNGVAGPVRGVLFGDAGQLVAQVIAIAVNAMFVFGRPMVSSS